MTGLALTLFFFGILIAVVLARGGLSQVARKRLYKSGTRWCVWRWTDVESEYILRLHVVKTPWFAVCLHWIRKPDQEPWLHDHPVTFFSLILRGGYSEHRGGYYGKKPRFQTHRWWNFFHASEGDTHRIVFCRRNTLTLCFMGPKTREWGFHVWKGLDARGWIGWQEYYARLKAGEDMRCLHTFDNICNAAARAAERGYAVQFGLTGECMVDTEGRAIDMLPSEVFVPDEEIEEKLR